MTGCLLNAMAMGDQQLVKTILKPFTGISGTDYLNLARIPTGERIASLAATNRKEVHQSIAAQIEYAMKFFNIPNGLNLEQIFLLTDTIIDDAEFDNISIQDVFVFLQKLSTGKMGTIYNRLDIPTFLEMFQVHRNERIKAIEDFREEQHSQFKATPINDRLVDMFPDDERKEMHNAMADYLRKK
jgi:hypothetical protein